MPRIGLSACSLNDVVGAILTRTGVKRREAILVRALFHFCKSAPLPQPLFNGLVDCLWLIAHSLMTGIRNNAQRRTSDTVMHVLTVLVWRHGIISPTNNQRGQMVFFEPDHDIEAIT